MQEFVHCLLVLTALESVHSTTATHVTMALVPTELDFVQSTTTTKVTIALADQMLKGKNLCITMWMLWTQNAGTEESTGWLFHTLLEAAARVCTEHSCHTSYIQFCSYNARVST